MGEQKTWIAEIFLELPGFESLTTIYYPHYQGDSSRKAEQETWAWLEEKWGRNVINALEKYLGISVSPY